jgi:hypothetical protein
VTFDADEPARHPVAFGRTSEQCFGDRKIARKLAPFLLFEALGDTAPDELLDIGSIAPEHARQTCEIFAALDAQTLKDKARIGCHRSFLAIGKFLDKQEISWE